MGTEVLSPKTNSRPNHVRDMQFFSLTLGTLNGEHALLQHRTCEAEETLGSEDDGQDDEEEDDHDHHDDADDGAGAEGFWNGNKEMNNYSAI